MEDGNKVPRVNHHKAVLPHPTRKVRANQWQRVLVGLEDRDKGPIGEASKAHKLARVLALRGDALYQLGKR